MMIAARLKWFALLAACCAVTYGLNHYRANTVREYLTSAQVYWRAESVPVADGPASPAAGSKAPAARNKALPVPTPAAVSDVSPAAQPAEAVITLTTAAEVRSEGLIAKGLRIAAGWAKLTTAKPDLRIGTAHVFTFRNGAWQEQKLSPLSSPLAFPLWPYNGHFYTWDKRQVVHEWNGHLSSSVPPRQAAELHGAFPLDPNNFVAAGTGNSPHPYDLVQDVISREEWHAYQNIASLPNGKHLVFPAGERNFEIVVRRARTANSVGEVSLMMNEAGAKSLPLWQAQPLARSVNAAEFVNYQNAPPLYPGSVSNPGQHHWLELGLALLTIVVVYIVFFKPKRSFHVTPTTQYVEANESDPPPLERAGGAGASRLDAEDQSH